MALSASGCLSGRFGKPQHKAGGLTTVWSTLLAGKQPMTRESNATQCMPSLLLSATDYPAQAT